MLEELAGVHTVQVLAFGQRRLELRETVLHLAAALALRVVVVVALHRQLHGTGALGLGHRHILGL